MVHFCILLLLAICWRVLLDKRHKLTHERKRHKEHVKAVEVKANNNYDPEYFIWKFSNPEDFGE